MAEEPSDDPNDWVVAAGFDPADPALIAHAHRRLGFGPHPGQVEWWQANGGVGALIDRELRHLDQPLPDRTFGEDDWDGPFREFNALMRDPVAGLHRKLLWFWHDHFAVSGTKVGDRDWLWQYLQLLHRHALGNFGRLVREITLDRAMLVYLDGDGSTASDPNENYSRELLELYTLGRGHYSEDDVRAGARVLAGWWIHWETGELEFIAEEAYSGRSRYLGVEGRLTVDDLVDAATGHPACAPFVAAKLHRSLVGTEPTAERLTELAELFVAADLEILPLVDAILRHPTFLDARGTRPRYPVEWIPAAFGVLGLPPDEWDIGNFEQLGQIPLYPPNPSGWPSGRRWLSPDQQLSRANMLIWREVPEGLVDLDDPVGSAFGRAGLHEVSDATRTAIQSAVDGADEWTDIARLALFLTVLSPEFALA